MDCAVANDRNALAHVEIILGCLNGTLDEFSCRD